MFLSPPPLFPLPHVCSKTNDNRQPRLLTTPYFPRRHQNAIARCHCEKTPPLWLNWARAGVVELMSFPSVVLGRGWRFSCGMCRARYRPPLPPFYSCLSRDADMDVDVESRVSLLATSVSSSAGGSSMTSSPWPTTTCRRSPPFTWWVWCGVVCLCSPSLFLAGADAACSRRCC